MSANNSSPNSFEEQVRALHSTLPNSERRVADFILKHMAELYFETGTSIARKCGVSEMTVSRLWKRLGFNGIASLKEHLRISDGLKAIDTLGRSARLSEGQAGTFLKREAEAILALADQLDGEAWGQAIDLLHKADEVVVAAFQMVRGEAEDFARRLSLIRPRVRYAATHDGCLTELTPHGDEAHRKALVIIDILPYAREAETVASIAKEAGFELIIITDSLNQWAHGLSDMTLSVRLSSELVIESTGPLTTLLALVVNEVSDRAPADAMAHMERWASVAARMRYFSTKASSNMRKKIGK